MSEISGQKSECRGFFRCAASVARRLVNRETVNRSFDIRHYTHHSSFVTDY